MFFTSEFEPNEGACGDIFDVPISYFASLQTVAGGQSSSSTQNIAQSNRVKTLLSAD